MISVNPDCSPNGLRVGLGLGPMVLVGLGPDLGQRGWGHRPYHGVKVGQGPRPKQARGCLYCTNTVQLLYKFAPKQKFYTQTQHQILQLHKPIVKIEPTKKNPYLNYTIAMNTTTVTTRALTNSTSLQSHHKCLARK